MSIDQQPDPNAAPTDGQGAPAADPSQAGAAAPVTADELARQLAEAQAKATEHFDAFVRARAEMDNIRRRASEDVAKAHKYAVESFAEALLPAMDSLEMALKVASPTLDSLREGVEATRRQLASAFEKNKLIAIDPVGEKFDPNRHQSISAVPVAATNPPVAAGHVVSVLQKGWLINDRILRPALVTVAQG